MRLRLPLYILFSFLLGSCAVNPVTGKQDLVLLSEQDEIALGRQTSTEVLKEYSVYDDNPALQKYVQEVGSKLAANSHRNNLVYRFTVLDSKEVNAFALPGGYIYITRGLLAYLKSEAELAAVLGHEIGHVTARHAVRQYSATQLANIGISLGAVFIPGMNQATNQLAQMFGTALLRGYGREHELEADRLGAEYLARSNYNPNAMLDVIRVLKNQESFETELARAEGREPNIYHGLFATHPDNDERLQEVIQTAQTLTAQGTINYVGYEEYMSLMDGLVYGDSPHEGILRGRNFYHGELGFAMSFPKNWNVRNQPDRILVAAPGGEALIQINAEDINKKISPRDFMIQRLGLNNLTNEAAIKINGLDGHTGISVINTSVGQRPVRFTVIYLDQRAYIIAGMTENPNELSKYDAEIVETARSFHALTENEKVLARPLRLKIVQAQADTRFSVLAAQSPIETYAESKLRLLNAKYPDGEPQAGELLKIVQ